MNVVLCDCGGQSSAPTRAAAQILTHVNRLNVQQDSQARYPIGSVFFENLPRLSWEARPQESGREDDLVIGLFPRKWNIGKPEPVGLRFQFRPDGIYVTSAEPADVTSEGAATQALLKQELERGPMAIKDLIEATGANPGTVRVLLCKLKDRGEVVNVGRGVWALAEVGE